MNDRQKLARWLYRTWEPLARWAKISPADPLWRVGIFLLASIKLRTTDPAQLADVAHIPVARAQQLARYCRKNKIWRGSTIRAEWFADNGDFAFLLDVMSAHGDIARASDPKVSAAYKAKRQKNAEAGKCVACGGERDSPTATCSKCKAAVKASVERRRERRNELDRYKPIEAWYQSA